MKWIKTYERWVYVGLIVIGATIWIIQQQEDTPVQPLSLEQVEQEEQQEQQVEEQANEQEYMKWHRKAAFTMSFNWQEG